MKAPGQYALMLLALGGCEKRTEVVAGEVVVGQTITGAAELSGRFEIRETNIERSVLTASNGGACLVAQVTKTPAACQLDSDCDIRPDPADPTKRWGGYCLPDDSAVKDSPRRCWVKPSNDYCAKGATDGAHSTPKVRSSEVYAYHQANPAVAAAKVQWRVTACLNGPAGGGAPPCAGGDGTMMRDYGPIAEPRFGVIPAGDSPFVEPRQPAPDPNP